MARPLRVEFAGAWFHVTARGNERRVIFRTDADRQKFVEVLAELPVRFGFRIHGYVLMPNHYHLIVETGGHGLSRAMQWLNVSYSVWFNRRHRRVGHLFQGRFGAVLVEAERWGCELSRYVHLNPVRIAPLGLGKGARAERRMGLSPAANVDEVAERLRVLREFRWSSYRAYIGLERPPPWLSVEVLRAIVGGPRLRAKQNYREWVEAAVRDGIAESPWEQVEGQLLLGGATLREKAHRLLKGNGREQSGVKELERREFGDVIKVVERIKGEDWAGFRDRHGDWGRDLALWLGRKHCGLRLRELGELAGGMDYAAVSAAVARWRQRMTKDHAMKKHTAQAGRLMKLGDVPRMGTVL